jgi:hypothetical protein
MEYEIDGVMYLITPTHFHVGYPGDREQPAEPSYWEYEIRDEFGNLANIEPTPEQEADIQELLCD